MIQPPGPVSPVVTPHPFTGTINGSLSADVKIMGKPAATMKSTATNAPRHLPIGGTFVKPPTNRGTIVSGSARVFINGKPAARSGDTAITCNDPVDLPAGVVVAKGTVFIG
ncbi:MAG TPA: PAAR domain-containing protein [Terrimicrobiaceae bacterium]|nr:PAAR domain-containing protein [Terrimicrobiaceae bacterium]